MKGICPYIGSHSRMTQVGKGPVSLMELSSQEQWRSTVGFQGVH